ncbi:MAG: trigger factor, partial [Candidatus Margulisiibacteriota bacterium]|nr:trigger factor [Candidatus Margulisiibacteriota bacterium]
KAIKYRCNVDVEPELKLKKYKGLKVTVDLKKADDETLKGEMDTLIGMHATYESVDREAADGDIVRFNSKTTIDGEVFDTWNRDNQATRIGTENYGKDFDAALVGLQKDDKKEISITYPDDYKNTNVQGKTVVFNIEVSEIRERKLPELTDELATKIDKDCKTVDEWKTKLKDEIEKRFESENEQKKEQAIFDALIDENPLDIPEQMIEQEVNMSLMQFEYTIRQQGMDLNQYMQITNKTQDDLRNDVKDSSKNKIHLRKIIEAVIEKEKLDVSDDDINTEIQSWNDEKIKTIDDLKSSKQHNLESLKNNILDKKVREFLTNSAKIK